MKPVSIKKKLLIFAFGVASFVTLALSVSSLSLIERQYSEFAHFSEAKSQQTMQQLQESRSKEQEEMARDQMEALRLKASALVHKDSLALGIALAENSIGFVRDYIQQSVSQDSDVVEGAFYALDGGKIRLWQLSTRDSPAGMPLGSQFDPTTKSWRFGQRMQKDPTLPDVMTRHDEEIRTIEREGSKYLEVSLEVVAESGAIGYLRYLMTTKNIDQAIEKAKGNLDRTLAQQKATEEASARAMKQASFRIKVISLVILGGVVALAFLFTMGISSYVANLLTNPIRELDLGANRVARGDYDTPINAYTNDEIGSLAKNFDGMRLQVRDFTQNLQKLVDERTQALQDELSRTSAILNTIEQGIITVSGEDLAVEGQMSSYVSTIFKLPPAAIVGQSLRDLLIAPAQSLDAEQKSMLTVSLQNCLGEHEWNFDVNRNKLPREMLVAVKGDPRIFQVDWCPMVRDDGTIRSLLVALKDLTDEKKREETLKKALEDQNRDMERIAAIVGNAREPVLIFIADVRRRLGIIESKLGSAGQYQREIYHELHTIKGQARSLNFADIANETHHAEDVLKQPDFDRNESLAKQIKRLEAVFAEYARLVADTLGWETRTRSTDLPGLVAKDLIGFRAALKEQGLDTVRLIVDDAVIHWKPSAIADLQSIITHLVNNAIDHGYLHPKHEGRQLEGYLAFRASRVEDRVILVMEDGGAGFDLSGIVKRAKELGIDLNAFENPIDVVAKAEFSTAKEITKRSGRGVGLSAVKSMIEDYEGTLKLDNRREGGSVIVMSFPSHLVTEGVGSHAAVA